jgi:hypothetical protein
MVSSMVRRAEVSWRGKRFSCTAVCLFVLGVRVGHMAPYSNGAHHKVHMIYTRHVTCFSRNGRWWKAKVVLPSTKTCRYPQEVWVEADAAGGSSCCPVTCLAWLLQSGVGGPNSPLVTKAAMGDGAAMVWTRSSFVQELKERLQAIGVDANRYSGISFRKGCLTELTLGGASPLAVAKQGTHKDINSQQSYLEVDEVFMRRNACTLTKALKGGGQDGGAWHCKAEEEVTAWQ